MQDDKSYLSWRKTDYFLHHMTEVLLVNLYSMERWLWLGRYQGRVAVLMLDSWWEEFLPSLLHSQKYSEERKFRRIKVCKGAQAALVLATSQ